ncbi:MAG TPA: DUF58 domain-containing protein [Opitutaceae bacterium]
MSATDAEWSGPGTRTRGRKDHRWRRLLWSLIYPRAAERILPTVPGVFLIALCMGIGMAAYNTANNILFITLSLLLACLILSGVLSWLNFKGVTWRLVVAPPLRVGQSAAVALELRNAKRFLPTYGLWFDVRSSSEPKGARLMQRARLDPAGGDLRLDWVFRPGARGIESIELASAGSLFPFGFLKKNLGGHARREVIIWPAPVEYQRFSVPAWSRPQGGDRVARIGQSGDLLALRKYSPGDSHRLIHWKASARLLQLMVRQFAAESQEGFSLWLESDAEVWSRPEQFELLCSFAVTLAEDLFKAGRLSSVAINDEAAQPVRRVTDIEAFFDRVAVLKPITRALSTGKPGAPRRRNLLTFIPDGARGVIAHVDGNKAASA